MPAQTVIYLSIRDSVGQIATSGQATIQAGSDTSCVQSIDLSTGGTAIPTNSLPLPTGSTTQNTLTTTNEASGDPQDSAGSTTSTGAIPDPTDSSEGCV